MSNGIYDYVDDVKKRLAEKDQRISELEEQLKNATKQVRKEEKIKINRLVRNWLIKEGFTAYKFDELFEEIRGTENE